VERQEPVTGWVNVPLTEAGEREAVRAGRLLAAHRLLPGLVHSSVQRRTIRTAGLALAECDRDWMPVRRSWRLNSNHYGALHGRNKAEVLAESGERQYMVWRRSYDTAPPRSLTAPRTPSSPILPYAVIPYEARLRAESLTDLTARLLPYWYDAIVPDLRTGACVLVVSHGNTLRALVKHLGAMSEERVAELDIPTGVPLAYVVRPDMRPVVTGCRYLGPGPRR
jgi:2,3-bisphosphoglycerate-dependent phosphoglycerate mutase